MRLKDINFSALTLFTFQVYAHIGLVYGIFAFNLIEWLIVLTVYFATGCLGVTITYHRLLSHKAFTPIKNWEKIGTFCATWGLIGSSIAWVNNHRSHHRWTDEKQDPHSPLIIGFWNVQFLSMFYSEKNLGYAKDLLRKKFHVLMHKNYFWIHLGIITTLLLVFGFHVTAIIYLAPAAILWNMGSLINNLGHIKTISYRNFDTPDESQNNPYLGLLVWGEGWHNNHHNDPFNANFGTCVQEFDLGYFIIDKYLSIKGQQ